MSINPITARQRAQSTVSLRKRLLRTNSEDKGSQLKKSSTMTSFRPKLDRLFQEGKIQLIMNSDPSSKAHLFYKNHVNEMQKQLASTKKSLSTLIIKSRTKESSINNVKNDIKKVQREIDIIKQQATLISKTYTGTNEELFNKRTEQEAIYWNQKMYTHVKARGYKDEVFLKGRYERLQREYNVEEQNRRLLENKYHELKQLNKQLQGMRHQAREIAQKQAVEKSQFINLLEADMQENELLGELKADKHKREGQINQIASSLIQKEELERILQVLYSHRILSQIIRTKSSSLLKRYQNVNLAYNHIKSNSNIIEPDKILKRMEEHDKLYDDALKRVSALEAQLNNFESNIQKCMITKNEILSKEGNTEILNKGFYQGLEKDKYELLVSQRQKLQERNVADEVLRKNIQLWGGRMFAHFGISQSENNNFLDCLTDLVVRTRQQK